MSGTGRPNLSVTRQIVLACLVLGALGGGVALYALSRDEPAAAAVRQVAPAVPVQVATAVDGTISERIEAVGTTLARQAVDIVSLTSGRIAELRFAPGERVEAGEVLVRLDDEMERAAVTEAQASLREAELALERARKLRANNTVAQATVDELEAAFTGAEARVAGAQRQLSDRTVRAPFAGIVGLRRVDLGARVDDETVLTTLDDLDEVEIEFTVPEIFFGRLRPGQTVSASSTAFRDRVFEGRIVTIDSRIGEVSRAFQVRAEIPNPDLVLPAGMFMHVDVVLEERPAVLIPEEAVIPEGNRTYVFTVDGDLASRREVKVGQRETGLVEVVAGLQPGEQVVRSGLQRLRDGAQVVVQDAGPPAPPAREGTPQA